MGEAGPQRFGDYQLIRRLAQGGMAEIWLAHKHSQPDRDLVIKRIHQHLVADDQFLMMFLDEAKIAARLDHPGCVQIFDLGCIDGSYYLAMEYIHGEDIRSIAKQARKRGVPLPRKLAVEIVAGSAEGLHYAHGLKDSATGLELNVVHRDVSPQNILVTYGGAVKIVDFGIAKAADQANRTQVGVLKGKYAYMSPEQVMGVPLDRRSDVFALGILLYELTTGKRLFKAPTELESMQRITRGRITPPTEISPGYPPKLESIVLNALARNRDERYESADALQRELRGFLRAHSCAVSPQELSQFMTNLFSDRIKAEKAASAVGDQEAFLKARFGEDSGGSKGAKPQESNDIEIDIEDSGEPEKEPKPPIRSPAPVKPRTPIPPPSAPAPPTPARTPPNDPSVWDEEPRTLVGAFDPFAEDASPREFDRTDPLRSVSEVFPSGPPGTKDARLDEASARQSPPTLGAFVDDGATLSGVETSPGLIPPRTTREEQDPKDKTPASKKKIAVALALTGLVAAAAAVLFLPGLMPESGGGELLDTAGVHGAGADTEGGSLESSAPDTDSGQTDSAQTGSADADSAPVGVDGLEETAGDEPGESAPVDEDGTGAPVPGGEETSPDTSPPTPPTAEEPDPTPSPTEPPEAKATAEERETPRTKAPRREQQRRTRQTARAVPRVGYITIRADAPGVVVLDGEEIGSLPLQRHEIAPGTHTFLVKGEEVEQRVRVRINAGQNVTRSLSLKTGLLRVRARPWADIYIDGRQIGTTPFAPVRVPAGNHTLEARNPDLDVRREIPFRMEPDGELLLTIDLLDE